MKKADIKVGFSCNNNCKFCVQAHKRNLGDRNTEEIKKILREAAKDCEIVVFTGGEPTIRPDIIELIEYAKNLKFKIIQIQSNGRMFAYKDFCRKMIKAGANEFALALHGHIPQLHDYLTSSKGAFEQTVLGIKNLKELRQRVLMNTVITKSNYRHLPEIAKLFINLKVDQYQFAFVHPLGNAWENFDSIVPRISLVEPYVKKGLELGIRAKIKVMVEAIPYCFMKGYENYIAENIMPKMKIFEKDSIVENFEKSRREEGKAKGPKCSMCIYNEICEGPWKEYPERFGWGEFQPRTK
jgi:AhpD family alkylhydroperoxidase